MPASSKVISDESGRTRTRNESLGDREDSAVDPMPVSVTLNTKRNQVFRCIMTELTPGIQMMDFQHCCGTAILTSPSISVEHLVSKCFVAFRIQF